MAGAPGTVDAPPRLGDVLVIGGGCYGTFYTRQLEAARDRERVSYRRILVIDQDPGCQVTRELGADPSRELVVAAWGTFLQEYLSDRRIQPGQPDDVIVPSPLMPHLMYQWLLDRARRRWPGRDIRTVPVPGWPPTPYDTSASDHTRYLSFADWTCPTHCVEPALCPVIRAPRTWEMGDTLRDLARGIEGAVPEPVLFHCRHTVFGVGTFGVREVLEGERVVAEAGAGGSPVRVLVGTISSCHGAVNLMQLGPLGTP